MCGGGEQRSGGVIRNIRVGGSRRGEEELFVYISYQKLYDIPITTSRSGFLFLRFICPALLKPQLFDLVSGMYMYVGRPVCVSV